MKGKEKDDKDRTRKIVKRYLMYGIDETNSIYISKCFTDSDFSTTNGSPTNTFH